jgi:phosphoribosylanthranilate isomerase
MVRDVAVKICGVCSATDAARAAAAGASYVGVILAPGRARSRSLSEAAVIFEGIGSAGADGRSAVRRVGVFVDAGADEIVAAAELLRLDVVQLHGDEDAALARAAGGDARMTKVWKAVRVRSPADVVRAAAVYEASVHGLLLDGWSPHGAGGVGAAFDRVAVAAVRDRVPAGLEVIAAGGLTPGNVADMIRLLRPDVVDVSSGVEEVLCRKSAERMRAFVAAVRGRADKGDG